jgi:hypothetical protein
MLIDKRWEGKVYNCNLRFIHLSARWRFLDLGKTEDQAKVKIFVAPKVAAAAPDAAE